MQPVGCPPTSLPHMREPAAGLGGRARRSTHCANSWIVPGGAKVAIPWAAVQVRVGRVLAHSTLPDWIALQDQAGRAR